MIQAVPATPIDVWPGRLAWLLFIAATGLYFTTRQAAIAADGIYFDAMLHQGQLVNHHLLYLPLAEVVRIVTWRFVDVSPELAMKSVSALAGGVGVAVTFLCAHRTLQSRARALLAAVSLMGLLGYWFHSTATELHSLQAASASVLLLGLLRALDGRDRLDRASWLLCFAGTLLVPLSHMSGYAAGLPISFAIWRVRAELRRPLVLALTTGALVFGAIYGTVYLSGAGLGDKVEQAVKMNTTGFAWQTTLDMSVQFTLYALPVGALIPAGLRVLFRTAPHHAWFCLLWVAAWPLSALRHLDDLYGSYHTPTNLVAVILAVVALHGVARTVPRALIGLALAATPAWFLCTGDRVVGLVVWAVAATLLFLLAGSPVRRPRWTWLLPLFTFAVTVPILWPVQRTDLHRDRIQKIQRLSAPNDVVLVLPASGYERFHWGRFFRRSDQSERAICPADLDWHANYQRETSPKARGAILATYRTVVRDRLRQGLPIWFVGEIAGASGSSELNAFYEFLRKECRFEQVEAAPLSIYRLVRKK